MQGTDETPLLLVDDMPLQEVVEHRMLDGRSALLATGAGQGRYWAISVASIVDGNYAALGFDVACRERPPCSPPAVRYRLAEQVTQNGDRLLLPDGREIAVTCGAPPSSDPTQHALPDRIATSAGQLLLSCDPAPPESAAKMARWRYEFRLVRTG